MEEPQPSQPPLENLKTYTITASSISYTRTTATSTNTFLFKPCTTSPPTYILRNVSLTAFPSQILAIVGPSGAGKSTLLDILATKTAPSSGTLLLNSFPLNPSLFRKFSAYVPQHDCCLPLLTVSETFAFSARLLNPKSPNTSSIVQSLLSELRLTHLAHTKIACGLSGGELRRVSIGLSLLNDPGVLLLDEPTSGLDSSSAFKVIQTLRSMADSRHRTVILSIHQPSFKILSSIDKVLLLSKGTIVHHGSIFSLQEFLLVKGFTVPPQLNPLEYAMEILNQIHETKPITPQASLPPSQATIDSSSTSFTRYKSSRVHEIVNLYSRFWKIIYRTKQLLLTNALEALFVGLVLGTIYINIGFDKKGIEKRLGLFAFTLTFLLSSTTETLPIFINERPILLRETSSGVYRLSSYLIANTLVFLPYLLAIAVIYSVSVYFLVGSLLYMASFCLLCSCDMGYLLLGCFFLFSGYFISTDSMPKYWLFMHYLSMYKYALDALLINEYSCLVTKCLIWFDENKTCMATGGDVLGKRGLHEGQRWKNIYLLLGFFVFYRFLWLVVLIRRVSRSKK
ncbi:ABC-2 type transporter family protein [Actinidia rufa]|uniref:ABC-2 type transporter family protein n=1 Tax=Actinidia rufa TaxID=165716 RepID=A0A7J0ECE2_9ERIC|nr:ABC-2 type transporter family protein [Actinidia rufa]